MEKYWCYYNIYKIVKNDVLEDWREVLSGECNEKKMRLMLFIESNKEKLYLKKRGHTIKKL